MIPTDEDTGYKVSVAALDEAVTANTKLLVFVSPSNPTGAVYTPMRSRRSVGGRSRRVSGSSPTRSMNTSSTAAPGSPRCRCRYPSWLKHA